MRNRLVVSGSIAVAVLGVLVALTALYPPVRQISGPRTGLVVAGVVLTLGVAVLAVRRPATAARRAAWFAVPALALGAVWWWQPHSAFGWFAYAPLSATVIQGSPATDLLLPALVGLLLALATTGAVTLVGVESPVRVLAIVATALTAPLWVAPGPRVTASGWSLAGEVVGAPVTVVRTVSLLLAVAIGAAVLLAGRSTPARAAAYVLPAAGLSWVWWRSGGGATIGVAGSGGTPLPSVVDRLPWLTTAVAASALVVVLWVLAFLGSRVLFARYRPPGIAPVSSSGR
ncbi:hypothetical protein [Cellulomonas sp. ICMP 17802]|uniref:hypothetical protein n=1 Tax=Cellulomonas sp. ICMP 17802 TaxID=3239199 RepID=UPI00351B1389